jgi:hypothetical protein
MLGMGSATQMAGRTASQVVSAAAGDLSAIAPVGPILPKIRSANRSPDIASGLVEPALLCRRARREAENVGGAVRVGGEARIVRPRALQMTLHAPVGRSMVPAWSGRGGPASSCHQARGSERNRPSPGGNAHFCRAPTGVVRPDPRHMGAEARPITRTRRKGLFASAAQFPAIRAQPIVMLERSSRPIVILKFSARPDNAVKHT